MECKACKCEINENIGSGEITDLVCSECWEVFEQDYLIYNQDAVKKYVEKKLMNRE